MTTTPRRNHHREFQRPRRWAILCTTSSPHDDPTSWVSATFWTRWAAENELAATGNTRHLTYRIEPSDHAPYRHRRDAITRALDAYPLALTSIHGLTAMTRRTITDTLLRMAREHLVTHRVLTEDLAIDIHDHHPAHGVWRLIPAHERHPTP